MVADSHRGGPAAGRRVKLLFALGCVLATACAGPCETLADRVCAHRPLPDPVCVRLRAIADAPTAADRQGCEAGNALADAFQKR